MSKELTDIIELIETEHSSALSVAESTTVLTSDEVDFVIDYFATK